ncbi:MAG TPA: hypothetical protein DCP92_23390 [Nitrospiraceae bacterium]|jgi:cell division protein FtsB|nr:hypothetical protein [Nitrospiraceae bacterium]
MNNNLLRKQVASEIKRRRLIISTIILLSFLYLGVTLIFGNTGFLRYLELREKKVQIQREIKDIEAKKAQLKADVKLLKENPFYIEKYAREDFGMAKPDEYIFKYDR